MTSSEMPSRIAIKCPFAGAGEKSTIADVSTDAINYPEGFPDIYAAPLSGGGRMVSRGEVNAIGNIATNDLFYHKCGGINTFDAAFAEKVGGYPKGAVLQYLNGTFIYDVISLVDHNLVDFTSTGTIDNVNWAYCNKNIEERYLLFSQENNLSSLVNAPAASRAMSLQAVTASRSGVLGFDVDCKVEISRSEVLSDAVSTGLSAQIITGVSICICDVTDSSTVTFPCAGLGRDGWTRVYSFQHSTQLTVYGAYLSPIVESLEETTTYNIIAGRKYHFAYIAGSYTSEYGTVTTTLNSIKIYVD